jgi:hypothetical protein
MITSPNEMRALASWYRERAEATENPTIWESRLRTAQDLEEMAVQADCRPPSDSPVPAGTDWVTRRRRAGSM